MKAWSLLFGLTAVVAVAAFVYAPFDDDWWLPSYQATNAEGLATLREIDARAAEFAGRVAALEGIAGPASPEQLAPLDDARAWLGPLSGRLGTLGDGGFLGDRIRSLRDEVARATAAVSRARAALADGPDPAAVDGVEEALGVLREQAAGAIASVAGPGGSVRGPASSAARQIDHLYILILAITGLTFIGVMGAMVVALWRFGARPGRKAVYSHGSLKVEIAWTIIPGAILVFLALYQLRAWADIKFKSAYPDVAPTAEVTGRQFQWKIRYPGPDGALGTGDDLHTVNDLHFVQGEPTIIQLKSEDVLHSFFLPQLRIKQDAVPGMTIPVLFDAEKAGRYELLCAELCGWGHYKMRADVTVHETRAGFDEWLERSLREQDRSEPDGTDADADAPPEGGVAASAGPRVE